MKGWKTLVFNFLLVIGPPALAYLASVNWADYISPTWAPVIVGLIGIILRAVTTTPVGRSNSMVEFTPTGRKMVIGFLIGAAALFSVSFGGPARAADVNLPAKAAAAPTPTCAIAFCTGAYAGGGLDGNGTSADILGSGLNGSVFGAGAIPSVDAGYQYWNGSILFDGEVGIGYAMPARSSVNGVNANPGQTGFLAYQEFQVGGQLSGLLGQSSQPSLTVPTALAPYLIAPYAAIGVAEQQGGSTGMDVGGGLKFAFSPNLLLDLGYRHYSLTTVSGPVVTKDDNLIRLRLNYVFKGF